MKIYLLSFVLLGLTISCSNKETIESRDEQNLVSDVVTLTETQMKNAEITVGTYSEELVASIVKASGRLEAPPQNIVSISTPFGGFIKSMDLLQGMKIRKGQIVVQLQHPDYIVFQQNYVEQKSELEYLDAEYQRQQELAKDNINAQKSVQSAKSKFEIAKAKVDGLKARLQLMNLDLTKVEKGEFSSIIKLFAPFNGFVTEVNVNLGQYVNPDNIIVKIIDNQHLHAELRVFEKDIFKIKVGQVISFVLNGDNGVRKASVHLIGKEISSDRTITIHGHLEKEDPELLPGMFLTAEIETSKEKSNVLPEEAVVTFEGESFVFLAESSSQFKMVKVNLGISRNGKVVVEFPSAINNKTSLVLSGAYSLLSMLKNGEEEF
jgi:cobalt-zinc-cadmium efflux system membrane fusion protein